MTLRSFFLMLTVVFFPSVALANGIQNIEMLRQHVLDHSSNHYREVYGKDKFENNVKIQVSRLDTRLRLAKCDDNLSFLIQEPPHNPSKVTVKVSCEGDRRWTVYVPVSLDIFAEILVAARSLERGEILGFKDLALRRVNVASLNRRYLEDMSRAEGMELRRPLRSGEVLKMSYLSEPDIVHKGQTVVVSTNSRFLNVETSGIAMVDGYLGERIKVKNQRSNRIINAEVVAPGKVMIATR